MNLLTCADFSERQPRGFAEMPRFPGTWAPPGDRIVCDYDQYDMRRKRLCHVRNYGWRLGAGASKRQPGLDVFCCALM